MDAFADNEVLVAISFLAELGEQEIIDDETAAKLDKARAEPGDRSHRVATRLMFHWKKYGDGTACDPPRSFSTASIRDFARLDRVV